MAIKTQAARLRKISGVRIKKAAECLDVAMAQLHFAKKMIAPAVRSDALAESLSLHMQFICAQIDVLRAHLVGPNNLAGDR